MTRRIFCKVLLVVVAVFGLFVLSSVLLAQGRSEEALEHVKDVQERNIDRLMAMDGVEGTAIGYNQNDRLAIKVFTAGPGVRGIPQDIDGVPVQVVVTGKFYALPKPPSPPGQDKKNPPPAAPTGLTATAVSDTEINLDWEDNTESDLAGYNVYRSTSAGSYGDPIASTGTTSAYSDSGLAAGTYYYVVTAVDDAGKESENSNEASAAVPPDTDPPAAPTDLTATPASSSQIDLSWTDNADNENGFKIEREIADLFQWIATVGANVTSYSDTGLNSSTEYTYRVLAYNDAGDSAYSDAASATTEDGSVEEPIGPRPAPIGVSTGHPDITAGTIGCRVTRVIDSTTVYYALSNNHVYANSNKATIGDNVLQPGTIDGGVDPRDAIGTLAAFEWINFGPRGSNTIDAAIALTTTGMLGNATPSDGYDIPSSAIFVGSVDNPLLGQPVQKYGRTTGLTQGVVDSVSGNFRVHYSSGFAIFVDQIVITPGAFSAGGDSGSLIVTDDEACSPVGLLFAGSSSYTIANPIDEVLGAFGVTIDGK